MPNFAVTDRTTGYSFTATGSPVPYAFTTMTALTLPSNGDPASLDSYAVTPTGSDLYIMTGSGNDSINGSGMTGIAFIDAGSGQNAITGGQAATTFSVEQSTALTYDNIANFHAGDLLVLNLANNGFHLSFAPVRGVGTMLTVTDAGFAPVYVCLDGVAMYQDLNRAIGHGGSEVNIGLR